MNKEQLNKLQHILKRNITTEELQSLDRIETSVKELIEICGDDPERIGFEETPFRVIKSFLEQTRGYDEVPGRHLNKIFDVTNNKMIVIDNIGFHSMCEHHLVNFSGVVHIGYIPNDKVTGLSKFGRLVEVYAKRFQVQERMTDQIKDAIEYELNTKGVIVVAKAKHLCMCSRGIKKTGSETMTMSFSGDFESEALRNDFFKLVNL